MFKRVQAFKNVKGDIVKARNLEKENSSNVHGDNSF